jgi:hypothetical protein
MTSALVQFEPEAVRGREVKFVDGVPDVESLTSHSQGWDLVAVVVLEGTPHYLLTRGRRLPAKTLDARRQRCAEIYREGVLETLERLAASSPSVASLILSARGDAGARAWEYACSRFPEPRKIPQVLSKKDGES